MRDCQLFQHNKWGIIHTTNKSVRPLYQPAQTVRVFIQSKPLLKVGRVVIFHVNMCYQLEGFTTEHCRPPSADGVGTAVWFMAHHQHIIPKAPITHLYRSASAFDLTESLSTLSPELTHGPLPLEWSWIWSPWPPLSPFPCTAVTHIQCPPQSLSHSQPWNTDFWWLFYTIWCSRCYICLKCPMREEKALTLWSFAILLFVVNLTFYSIFEANFIFGLFYAYHCIKNKQGQS